MEIKSKIPSKSYTKKNTDYFDARKKQNKSQNKKEENGNYVFFIFLFFIFIVAYVLISNFIFK